VKGAIYVVADIGYYGKVAAHTTAGDLRRLVEKLAREVLLKILSSKFLRSQTMIGSKTQHFKRF
jgi:hypothetical protein